MYDIKSRESAILSLNAALLDIAYFDTRIPKVSLEPIFSKRTEDAVLAIQHATGLAPSGRVDYPTHLAIIEKADEAKRQKDYAQSLSFPSELPLSIGSNGSYVLILQAAISELSEYYEELPRVAITGSYKNGTAYAVSLLQRKYRLPETGNTDARTWHRILLDLTTRDRLSIELNR